MSVVSELTDYIGANISSLTVGDNLFEWMLPDGPDEAIAVRDTGAQPDDPAVNLSDHSFQIKARAPTGKPNIAQENLREVYDLLVAYLRCPDEQKSFNTANYFFRGFRAVSTPQTLGIDEKQRPIYVINISSFVTD